MTRIYVRDQRRWTCTGAGRSCLVSSWSSSLLPAALPLGHRQKRKTRIPPRHRATLDFPPACHDAPQLLSPGSRGPGVRTRPRVPLPRSHRIDPHAPGKNDSPNPSSDSPAARALCVESAALSSLIFPCTRPPRASPRCSWFGRLATRNRFCCAFSSNCIFSPPPPPLFSLPNPHTQAPPTKCPMTRALSAAPRALSEPHRLAGVVGAALVLLLASSL